MTNANPFAIITERLAPGAALVRKWRLHGGVSAQVDALEIRLPDGAIERIVVRRHGATDWKPLEDDVTSAEYHLLSALHAEGIVVPEPLLLDTSGDILPSPFMAMTFVDGSTEVDPNALPDGLPQMASFLTSLHGLDPGSIELPALPRRDDPWDETERYLPNTPLGERIRAVYERHGPIMSTSSHVLLHGDFWPGNIIWQDGRIVAVIDWEDAAIGDPAADLAGSRLELLWRYGPDVMRQFTSLYLSAMPIDLATLPFWEICGATGASALMGEWGLEPDVEADMRAKAAWLIEDALQHIALLSVEPACPDSLSGRLDPATPASPPDRYPPNPTGEDLRDLHRIARHHRPDRRRHHRRAPNR